MANYDKTKLHELKYFSIQKKLFKIKETMKYCPSKVLSKDSDVTEAKVKVGEIYSRIYKKLWKFNLTAFATSTLMKYILVFFSVSVSAKILLSSLDVNKKLRDNFHLLSLLKLEGVYIKPGIFKK